MGLESLQHRLRDGLQHAAEVWHRRTSFFSFLHSIPWTISLNLDICPREGTDLERGASIGLLVANQNRRLSP